MTNPLRTQAANQIGIFALRLALGATFLLYGIEKVFYLGVTKFVSANTQALPDFLPRPIGQTYLYAIPFLEILLGAFLMMGLFTRTTAAMIGVMLVSYIFAVTGVFWNHNWMHLHFNMSYLAMAVALSILGGGAVSLDRAIFKDR